MRGASVTGSAALAAGGIVAGGMVVGGIVAGGIVADGAAGSTGAGAGGGGVSAAGWPPAPGSTGRSRGFKRREGVGVGSSLMGADQRIFRRKRETKNTLNFRSRSVGRMLTLCPRP